MSSVRARAAPFRLRRDFSSPGLSTHFFGSQEVAVVDGLVRRPKPARAAKVGYSRFGADSCAGKDDHPLALIDQLPQFLDSVFLMHCYDSSDPPSVSPIYQFRDNLSNAELGI